jgi:uncharacterized membrane protein YphA (DoxX/SURF4 family)/CDGSH-type Zn-finger protein
MLSADGKLRLYGYKTAPPQPLSPPKIVDLQPMVMTLAPGRYSWCSCGYSKKQPFCDDSHRAEENATNRRSYKFEVLEEATIPFCMCRQTGNPPYCDNTCQALAAMVSGVKTTAAAPVTTTTPLAAALPSLPQAAASLPRETVVEVERKGPYVQLGTLGSVIMLLGRLALAYMFIRAGFNHLTDLAHTTEGIANNMAFIPESLHGPAAMIAGVMLLFGGLMVLLGGFTQLGALLLILFLVPTLLFFHNFWDTAKFADELAVRMQTIQWQKNLAMVGGLLVLLAAGPGSISLDRMFRRNK